MSPPGRTLPQPQWLQHFYKGRLKSGVQAEDRPPVQVRASSCQ